MTSNDVVNAPSHYISGKGIETIDVIEAFTADLTGMEAVCTANALKYLCRWKRKNGKEDLRKARWYIDHLLGEHDKPTDMQNIREECCQTSDLIRYLEDGR